MVSPVDLLSLLPKRCHPQALGHLFHGTCGGGSAGCVTRQPFWFRCSSSPYQSFVAGVPAPSGSLNPSSCDVSSSSAAFSLLSSRFDQRELQKSCILEPVVGK